MAGLGGVAAGTEDKRKKTHQKEMLAQRERRAKGRNRTDTAATKKKRRENSKALQLTGLVAYREAYYYCYYYYYYYCYYY